MRIELIFFGADQQLESLAADGVIPIPAVEDSISIGGTTWKIGSREFHYRDQSRNKPRPSDPDLTVTFRCDTAR